MKGRHLQRSPVHLANMGLLGICSSCLASPSSIFSFFVLLCFSCFICDSNSNLCVLLCCGLFVFLSLFLFQKHDCFSRCFVNLVEVCYIFKSTRLKVICRKKHNISAAAY